MNITPQEQDDFYATLDSLYYSKRRELQPGEFTINTECERTGRSRNVVSISIRKALKDGKLECETLVINGKATVVYRLKGK